MGRGRRSNFKLYLLRSWGVGGAVTLSFTFFADVVDFGLVKLVDIISEFKERL